MQLVTINRTDLARDVQQPARLRDHSRDDAEYCHCDAEPNTEKPGSDGNWRQVKDKERVFETGNVVKPANECHQKQTKDYDQASLKHQGS